LQAVKSWQSADFSLNIRGKLAWADEKGGMGEFAGATTGRAKDFLGKSKAATARKIPRCCGPTNL